MSTQSTPRGWPAYPTRGFRGHVPMAPEAEPAMSAAAEKKDAAATTATTTVTTEVAKPTQAQTTQAATVTTTATVAEPAKAATTTTVSTLDAERESLAKARQEIESATKVIQDAAKKDLDERRLNYLRSIGLSAAGASLSESEVLGFAPQIDPRDPSAAEAYAKFQEARPLLFKPKEPDLATRLAKVNGAPNAPKHKDTPALRYSALAANVLSGRRGDR